VGELDNRGSHLYLAMYWAEGLANQDKDLELKAAFTKIANDLKSNEHQIVSELNKNQGNINNIGGYYLPNEDLANTAMRPNHTLNTILESI
jgi:isocitrate dehydrogenase